MPTSSPIPTRLKRHNRGNRFVGKMWLVLIFFLLVIMNYAASMVVPFIGSIGPIYLSALVISTFWNAILLASIWWGHGWARFVLSAFLMCFILAQASCLPDALVYYPALNGISTKIILLLSCTNFFVAVFLLISKDIYCLSRHLPD